MKGKKGVDMSLQTIVVAALVLLILVVLIVLFSGSMGNFGKSVSACEERSGFSCESECGPDQSFYSNQGCGDSGDVCCRDNTFNDNN